MEGITSRAGSKQAYGGVKRCGEAGRSGGRASEETQGADCRAGEPRGIKTIAKRFTPDQLGGGKPKGGCAVGRKLRFEVLDRLARTGVGLSAAQKNDWQWFKESWDAKMLCEHEAEWANLFCSWIQGVLDQLEAGLRNAFSLFVRSETQRCFSSQAELLVP